MNEAQPHGQIKGVDAEFDPVLYNDWHPVAASAQLPSGQLQAARLLGRELVLWRDAHATVHSWEDRCPHRGTRLSLGSLVQCNGQDLLVCRYHGWGFDASARCRQVPAQPELPPPPAAVVQAYAVCECYGLIWICLGEPAAPVVPFPEYAHPALRKVLCGPYEVASSGPRIVENFLDMAHFGFVHAGILGDPERTAIADYQVAALAGGGIIATDCLAWQPQTNTLAHQGSEVAYTYRVLRPLTAILTKQPHAQPDFHEAISLHVQPLEEIRSRVWINLALTNFRQTEAELRAFQDRIFTQDLLILENQTPQKLPLRLGAEQSVRSDRLSLAYRTWLRELGLHWGVIP